MFPWNEVLRFALDATFKVTLLLFAALAVRSALRSASAALRHALTTVALAGTLLLPLLSPWLPRLQMPLLANPFPKTRIARVERPVLTRLPDTASSASTVELSVRISNATRARPRETADAWRIGSRPIASAVNWPRVGLLLWAAGAVFVLARLAAGTARIRRIARRARPIFDLDWILIKDELARRLGLTRTVRIVQSDQVAVAMTYGAAPPLLLVSANADRWEPERRRLVLLHELAHVRRQDWIGLLLAEIVRAVYWFHPLVWVGVELARKDCEKACDDIVLTFGTKPSVYAAHLLGIVRSLPPRPRLLPAVPMARPSQFEARMRSILDRRRPRRGLSALEAVLVGAGVLVGVVATGAVQPWFDCPQQRAQFLQRTSFLRLPSLRSLLPLSAGDVEDSTKPKKPKTPCRPKKLSSHAIDRAPKAPRALRTAVREKIERGISSGIEGGIAQGISGGMRRGSTQGVTGGIDDGVSGGIDEVDEASQPKTSHYDKAADVSREYATMAADPQSRGEDFYRAGKRLLSVDSYELAARAFHQSADAGYRIGTSLYNEACARALAGDRERAMELLERALLAGFDDPSLMRKDSDLASLHSEKGFAETLKLADDLSLPGFSKKAKFGTASWQERAEHFAAFAHDHPEIGRAWFNLGFAKIQTREARQATEAFERALELDYRRPTTMYNLACSFALRGERDLAFQLLFHALDEGFEAKGMLKNDSDLNSLHGDARFREALERAERDSAHRNKG